MKEIDLTKETEELRISFPKGSEYTILEDMDIIVKVPEQCPFDLVPKSWDEYEEKYKLVTGYHRYFYCNKLQEFTHNVILEKISIFANSSQEANAFIALMQLRMLWHEWMKVLGEAAEESHFCIAWNRKLDKLYVGSLWGNLSFLHKEHAEKFIKCFGELLEQAKILL